MVYAVTTDKSLVAPAVRECFATDAELMARWHIAAPSTVDGCADRTLHDVASMDDSFKFYRAYVDGELAGYWGSERNGSYLNLIFVKPAYRSRRFMKDFWSTLKRSMQPVFSTAVYARNLPAVEFYSKHCAEKYSATLATGEQIVAFQFNQKKV